jgi:hypothetical protein
MRPLEELARERTADNLKLAGQLRYSRKLCTLRKAAQEARMRPSVRRATGRPVVLTAPNPSTRPDCAGHV